MEENQKQNPEQVNVSGSKKSKKKGMGPLKGLLLALLIVFLICVVGLLIRMVVADDGDYFKPIKQIFGIEGEDDENERKSSNKADKDKSKNDKDESETKGKKNDSFKSADRYQLLSDDVEDKNVKHYRLTLDMGEFFKKFMNEMKLEDNDYDYDDYTFDEELDEFSYDINELEDDYEEDNSNQLENMMEMAMMLLEDVSDIIDGEMYFDIYFEGNEIVQMVAGYDYGDFLEKLYDYVLEEDEDSFEEEGIENVQDLADYMVEQFKEYLDEDELYEMIMESAGEDVESQLQQFGIKEKDIKDAIDFNVDTGIIEFYINGTTKLKAILSMALESEGFKEELKEIEKETKTEIDEDNIIESMLKAANDIDEYSEYGFEFIEVK